MAKTFFRLRPKSRAEAATRDRRPKLTRERSSRVFLRRRDKEPSKGKGLALVRKEGAATGSWEEAKVAAILKRERRERDMQRLWMTEDDEPRNMTARLFLPDDRTRQTVCQTRAVRQQVLFAKNIAGHKGKSPGKGGTYRRTETSNETCERGF